MYENMCRQCLKVPNGPCNRLVQDSCGHKKCRECLLDDDERCTQCESDNDEINNGFELVEVDLCDRNGDTESEFTSNNHTGVIQVNGNVPGCVSTLDADNLLDVAENEEGIQSSKSSDVASAPIVENGETMEWKIEKPNKKNNKRAYQSISVPAHITVNSDPLSYHCTICDKKFITKTHVKYHTYCSGAPKPYKCEVCKKEFILRAQLDVHSYKHTNRKPHACQICKKSFSDRAKLTRHMVVHSTVKSHICPTCGNAYRSKESLRLHSITHKGEKPYRCKICPARFNNASNLNKHIVTHSKEKSHMCDQCGKRFKQKLSLSVHRKSHSKTRMHQCEVCSKSFVNNKDLKRHSLIHAEARGYACGICKTSFRRKDNLKRHMKNTHPGRLGAELEESTQIADAELTNNISRQSSTVPLSSRLRRRLLRATTILSEISTMYHLLSARTLMTWPSR